MRVNLPRLFFLILISIFVDFKAHGQEVRLDDAQKAYKNEQFEKAAELYGQLLNQNSKNYQILKGFADSKHKLEDFSTAITYYDLASEVNSQDPELFFNRAAAKVFVEDFRGAVKDIDVSLEMDPNNPRAFYYRGYANSQLEKYNKAIEDYTQAIQLDPDYSAAYYNRGAAKAELDNFNAGMADFEMALNKNPKLENGKLNIALSKLGMKMYAEAITELTAIIDQRGENIDRALFYRAEANYELGNKDLSCSDWLRSSNLGYEQATSNYNDFCKSELKKKKGINIIF